MKLSYAWPDKKALTDACSILFNEVQVAKRSLGKWSLCHNMLQQKKWQTQQSRWRLLQNSGVKKC